MLLEESGPNNDSLDDKLDLSLAGNGDTECERRQGPCGALSTRDRRSNTRLVTTASLKLKDILTACVEEIVNGYVADKLVW